MAPHNDSKSQTRLELGPGALDFVGRFQSLSLLEEMPGLDLDGDARLSAAECEAGRSAIGACLNGGYLLGPAGQPAAHVQALSVELLPRTLDGFGMPQLELLRVSWRAQWPEGLGPGGPLLLRNVLFQSSSPGHLDLLSYSFDGQLARTGQWVAGGAAHPLVPPAGPDAGPMRPVAEGAWQAGAGLALVLAIACGWRALGRKNWLRGALRGALALLVTCVLVAFWTEGLGGQGSPGSWFLPLALVYVLLDSRLGPGPRNSTFSMMLWGACFAMGVGPGLGGLATQGALSHWQTVGLACLSCWLLALGLRPLWIRWPGQWSFRLALLVAVVICLLRVTGRFM